MWFLYLGSKSWWACLTWPLLARTLSSERLTSSGPGQLWEKQPSATSGFSASSAFLSGLSDSDLDYLRYTSAVPIAWVLNRSRALRQTRGAAEAQSTQPAFPGLGHYFNNFGYNFRGTSPGPRDFCWSWGLREACNSTKDSPELKWMKPGNICSCFPNICLKPPQFCSFSGQMDCHIHVHPLPSNLFIKREKLVVAQFLLSRWLILISLQQARFISGWNQSRWKCCCALRILFFLKRWMGWRCLSVRTVFRRSFHQRYFEMHC